MWTGSQPSFWSQLLTCKTEWLYLTRWSCYQMNKNLSTDRQTYKNIAAENSKLLLAVFLLHLESLWSHFPVMTPTQRLTRGKHYQPMLSWPIMIMCQGPLWQQCMPMQWPVAPPQTYIFVSNCNRPGDIPIIAWFWVGSLYVRLMTDVCQRQSGNFTLEFIDGCGLTNEYSCYLRLSIGSHQPRGPVDIMTTQ